DLTTGKEVRSLGGKEGHQGPVWAVAFSPDRVHVASASWDHTVKIWNIKTGRLERSLPHVARGEPDGARVQSISYDGAGRRLASATVDGVVQIWLPDEGRAVARYEIQVRGVDRVGTGFRAALGEKGESFIKGERGVAPAWGTTRKVWDATCSAEVLTIRGQAHHVASVAFSPDNRRLAFASGDA